MLVFATAGFIGQRARAPLNRTAMVASKYLPCRQDGEKKQGPRINHLTTTGAVGNQNTSACPAKSTARFRSVVTTVYIACPWGPMSPRHLWPSYARLCARHKSKADDLELSLGGDPQWASYGLVEADRMSPL